MTAHTDPRAAIGVFDSGVGGLTVLREILSQLPHEDTVYLGDTARVPYGTRSAETVIRYALNNARTLVDTAPIKLLVIACNTASAVALAALQDALPVPVIGVIVPGAQAALRQSEAGSVLVLGTAGTVRSAAYPRALKAAGFPRAVHSRACPLLCPLVEEGWVSGPIPEQVVARYLQDLPDDLDTVVLGCTHYPLLRDLVARALPAGVHVVDGAEVTAAQVVRELRAQNLLNPKTTLGTHRFLVTDAPEQLIALAPLFLGRDVDGSVELVDVKMTHHT